MDRLAGKVALITGGAQGQGAAAARAFVAEGAKVVIADIVDDLGGALADELGEAAAFVHLDVTSEDDWTNGVDVTLETFGALNVLINNAGILMFSELKSTALADYERVIRVNQVGTFLGMRAVVEAMEDAGGGSIVNSSSTEGLGGMAMLLSYGASKFAIRGMTKSAAMELGPNGIRVNSVHPGMINTGMVSDHADGMANAVTKVPLRRIGQPEDVANLYLYLASDESSYSTGAEFVVDGGVTATHAFGG